MNEIVELGHLGGYVKGGDEATHFPDLWRWLVNRQGVRSVIDVGCGEGHSTRFFRDLGCRVLGVDGVPQEDPSIVEWDYTTGPLPLAGGTRFDLCWSCEFVEHIEERFVPNFLPSFACADLVMITHAEPGQGGYHHVNLQHAAYWIGAMAAMGFKIDWDFTMLARAVSSKNESPWNHFARSGLAFRRYL